MLFISPAAHAEARWTRMLLELAPAMMTKSQHAAQCTSVRVLPCCQAISHLFSWLVSQVNDSYDIYRSIDQLLHHLMEFSTMVAVQCSCACDS